MKPIRAAAQGRSYLGIEAGGTRTVALLDRCEGRCSLRWEGGPANLRLLDDTQLASHFCGIARQLPQPHALAIGMAGARTAADRQRICKAAAKAWPGIPCYATNDLETALMAVDDLSEHRESGPTHRGKKPSRFTTGRNADRVRTFPRVLVLSGTGSCCFGAAPDGRTSKIGGWGHLLGDKGSGFEIGLRALKAVVYYLDRDGEWSALGQRLLRVLQLNEPNDLIGWAQSASKADIAALAVEVFNAAAKRDSIARDILEGAAATLADDAISCARRLATPHSPVQFVFAGSVLLKQPRFASHVARRIDASWRNALVSPLRQESARGALALARAKFPQTSFDAAPTAPPLHRWKSHVEKNSRRAVATEDLAATSLSPTEQRNPRSMNLDRLSTRAAIELMLSEEKKVSRALLAEQKKIERGVDLIVSSFRKGGRLFYIGAGTSGRLGVLDASECPPTFQTNPGMVQGIIAGGQRALWESIEGAEDDAEAGARAIGFRGVTRRDVVVGIAASGRTPFVWGAVREAMRRRASTILLCFNPNLAISQTDRPRLVIAPKIGPEVLTGSTRLKAGTATKLVLNIFTTLAMVRLGKVLSNLMIDVKPSNTKLRDRATRIVQELTGADYDHARAALEGTQWKIKRACKSLLRCPAAICRT
jgi:N-acetylmuramic acid 6-phosphate etherase